jgi:hypothetical protein
MHEVSFPVVGTAHIKGAYDVCVQSSNIPVDLEPDPENSYDAYAINVMVNGIHVGFVPNAGYTCSNCWSHADPYSFSCRKCGVENDSFIKGGLARRLKEKGILDSKYGCFVAKVNPLSKSQPITVKLVSTDIQVD